jgi:hypothetical protein
MTEEIKHKIRDFSLYWAFLSFDQSLQGDLYNLLEPITVWSINLLDMKCTTYGRKGKTTTIQPALSCMFWITDHSSRPLNTEAHSNNLQKIMYGLFWRFTTCTWKNDNYSRGTTCFYLANLFNRFGPSPLDALFLLVLYHSSYMRLASLLLPL